MSTKVIAIVALTAFLFSFCVIAMAKNTTDPDDKPDSCKTKCGYDKKDCIEKCDMRSKNMNDECHVKCAAINYKCKQRCPDDE